MQPGTVARRLSVWGLAVVAQSMGQVCQPGFVPAFANADVLNDEVRSVAAFDAGSGPRLYAAGAFSAFGGSDVAGLAVWNGTAWSKVGGGLGGGWASVQGYVLAVLTLGSQTDLYVGGSFEQPGRNIARWNGQQLSGVGLGFNSTVRAITVFDSGAGPALYASGHFYMSGSQEMRGVARWTGSAWQALGTGLTLEGAAWQPDVGHGYSMAALDLGDGRKLYVGGRFTSAGGVPAHNIARWDGQAWSAVGPTGSGVYGADAHVMKVGLFDHGFGPQLTIGGRFSLTPGGVVRPRVARWTGSAWVQVGSDLGDGAAHVVNSFVAVPGPAGPMLHVGGIFKGAGWLSQVNYAARMGVTDWVGLDGGMSDYIWSIAPGAPGSGDVLCAGGKFEFAGKAVAKRVARWDGTGWHGFETHAGLTGPVNAACVFDPGSGPRVFVGGEFVGAGSRVCNGIAGWNGTAWEPVGEGVRLVDGSPGQVTSLAVFDAGSGPALYAGGIFDTAGGGPCFNIASWDGARWSSPGGNGPNDGARAMAAFDDGTGPALYVGGAFGASSGIPTPGIVRWNGVAWSGVGAPSPGVTVNALAVFDDGQGDALYAAGQFLAIGGVTTPSIARWNGSSWQAAGGITISAASAFPGVVNALIVHDDGSGPALYAGGQFGGAGGVPIHGNTARWRNGAWSAVGTPATLAPTGPVHALAAADLGGGPRLFLGGPFTASFGSQTARSLLQWDGTAWHPLGTGVSLHPPALQPASVRALATHGASLFIGGGFGIAGTRSDNFAEWRECGCYADCNASGTLTIADFGCFQAAFAGGDPWADCNGSGSLSVADFACFQGSFAGGCP